MDWINLTQPIIIAAVPMVVAGLKRLIPYPWAYPVLAGVLGVAADAVAAYVTNVPMAPGQGAILGLAGVGFRELVHQFKKTTDPS